MTTTKRAGQCRVRANAQLRSTTITMARLRLRRQTIRRRPTRRRRVVNRRGKRRSQKGGFLPALLGSLIPLLGSLF